MKSKFRFVLPVWFILATVNGFAQAPTISYTGPKTYTVGTAISPLTPVSGNVASAGFSTNPVVLNSALQAPVGVALDAAGNIYVADTLNNDLLKIPAGGGAAQIINQRFVKPTGVAVDAAGDIYVVDAGDQSVVVLPVGGTSPLTPVAETPGLNSIAIDKQGNVFITYNTYVLKLPVGGGGWTKTGAIFSQAKGIAVDGQGYLYVADYGSNTVKKISPDGKTIVNIGTGFNRPYGVAVDGSGNVFVADSQNGFVKEIMANGGATVAIGSTVAGKPAGLVLDAADNLYVTDMGNGSVKEIKPTGGYWVQPMLPPGLTLSNQTGAITGTPAKVSPATLYTITAYNSTGRAQGTVTISVKAAVSLSYTGPDNYNINTAITPLTPTSKGVAAAGFNAAADTVAKYFSDPIGVTADNSGNIYVVDNGYNLLKKIPATGGLPAIIGSGFKAPTGVAIDAAGNLYVTDYKASQVIKIPANGSAQVAVGSGFVQPWGIAVDAGGNLYVTDVGNATVVKIPAAGGSPVNIGGSGLQFPASVAVDGLGNIYFVDRGLKKIFELPAGGGARLALTASFTAPFGVAVDGSGNLFVTDQLQNTVQEIPAGGGLVTLSTGVVEVAGIAVDGADNLYFCAQNAYSVLHLAPAGGFYINKTLPAGLTFNNTTGTVSGTPIAITPTKTYTVTGYNATGGNAANVSIGVPGSVNAKLSALTVSKGSLSPAFATATTSYTDAVTNATTSITITPTAADATAAIKVNGTTVASGAASAAIALAAGNNTITTVVTAQDGVTTTTYTLTVTRAGSTNANLATLKTTNGILTPAFSGATTSYTASVVNGVTAMTVTPTGAVAGVTIKVNGVAVASGSASQSLPLAVGTNTITIKVVAQDGTTTKVYTLVVTRAKSSNANLAALKPGTGTLSPAFSVATTSYAVSVANSAASITITPTTAVATSTVKVRGTAVTSGTASAPIALSVGANTINTIVTAQDGITTKTYTVTVTRAAAPSANLSAYAISAGILTPAFTPAATSYTVSVVNAVTTLEIIPTTADPAATVKVRGTVVTSGMASAPIALSVGANTINTIVTASNGATKTYTLTVTRAAGGADSFITDISVNTQTETPTLAEDGIQVHQGLSPNGDGINDFLMIENIGQYPDNKLSIMNRNGLLIYEASGYDNSSKVFDGHSNKNGQMQLPGTYFYQLDYTVKGITKHKTGFLVLKY